MDVDKVTLIAEALAVERGWSSPSFIAAGNSAAVYRVEHADFGTAALKVYDPAFFEGKNAPIEIRRVELQSKLRGHGNPYLIDVIDTGALPKWDTWYILMEFCPWPSLESVIDKVPNEAVAVLIAQLAEAVLYLDSIEVIHRDIKPANISVSDDFSALKLLDLGVARRMDVGEGSGTDGSQLKRFVATAQYSPPEYLVRREASGIDGFRAINLYQVGAVLHDLIMKKPIFDQAAKTENKYILHEAIIGPSPQISSPDVPARLLSICRAALEKNPAKRIQSVKLEDFVAPVDSADTIRSRLTAARVTEGRTQPPSLLLWKPRVRKWLSRAARAEADALGPVRMPEVSIEGGVVWRLLFRTSGRQVTASLRRNVEQCSLNLYLAIDAPNLSMSVATIYDDGPDAEINEVIRMLSENILYLVDVASNASPGEGGGNGRNVVA